MIRIEAGSATCGENQDLKKSFLHGLKPNVFAALTARINSLLKK
jgi:hypothetical protein